MRYTLRKYLLYPAIVCVLWTGVTTTLQDKQLTPLDNLAFFIRIRNQTLPYETSYHIANALLWEGKEQSIILSAIAAVESDFTPSAIGDSGRSRGMMQVQPILHGKVSTNVYEQVKQARKVLLEVHKISRYNGRGKQAKKYEAKVLDIAKRIHV